MRFPRETLNPMLALALVGAIGCFGHIKMTPEAQALRVTPNPEAVRGCQSLGMMEAREVRGGGLFRQDRAGDRALEKLRNNAAKAGANVILLSQSNSGMSGGNAKGEAYKCPST